MRACPSIGSVTIRNARPADAAADKPRKDRRDVNGDVKERSRSLLESAITHLVPPILPQNRTRPQNSKTSNIPIHPVASVCPLCSLWLSLKQASSRPKRKLLN